MRQISPGVWVDEPLPRHTTRVDNDWPLKLVLPDGFPLPSSISINNVLYKRDERQPHPADTLGEASIDLPRQESE